MTASRASWSRDGPDGPDQAPGRSRKTGQQPTGGGRSGPRRRHSLDHTPDEWPDSPGPRGRVAGRRRPPRRQRRPPRCRPHRTARSDGPADHAVGDRGPVLGWAGLVAAAGTAGIRQQRGRGPGAERRGERSADAGVPAARPGLRRAARNPCTSAAGSAATGQNCPFPHPEVRLVDRPRQVGGGARPGRYARPVEEPAPRGRRTWTEDRARGVAGWERRGGGARRGRLGRRTRAPRGAHARARRRRARRGRPRRRPTSPRQRRGPFSGRGPGRVGPSSAPYRPQASAPGCGCPTRWPRKCRVGPRPHRPGW